MSESLAFQKDWWWGITGATTSDQILSWSGFSRAVSGVVEGCRELYRVLYGLYKVCIYMFYA